MRRRWALALATGLYLPAHAADEPTLDLGGDLRYRQELSIVRPNDDPARWRQRIRARLAGKAQIGDVQAGLRVRTGNPDDANSPYRDLGAGFDSFEFALDRAYLKWSPGGGESWLLGGKAALPFVDSPVFPDFIWDDDVQPEGMAGKLHVVGDEDSSVSWDLMGGAYTTLEVNGEFDDGWLLAVQSALGFAAADGTLTLANALYHVPSTEPGGSDVFALENQGNALAPDGTFVEEFTIIDNQLIARIEPGGQKVQGSARLLVNVAASEENIGWQAGVALPAKVDDVGVKPWLDVHGLQREAMFSPVVQDDHQIGVAYVGATAGVAVTPMKRLTINSWGLFDRPDDPGPDDPSLFVRARVDVSTRF